MNLAYKGAYCEEIFCEFACNTGFTHDGLGIGYTRAGIFNSLNHDYSCDFGGRRQSNFAGCDPAFDFCFAFGFKPYRD